MLFVVLQFSYAIVGEFGATCNRTSRMCKPVCCGFIIHVECTCTCAIRYVNVHLQNPISYQNHHFFGHYTVRGIKFNTDVDTYL